MMKENCDPETGMPNIPDGYRWKVDVFWNHMSIYPEVRVSLKRRFFTVAFLEQFLAYLDPRDEEAGRTGFQRRHDLIKAETEDYPQMIYELAEQVLVKNFGDIKQVQYNREFKTVAAELSGTYPPKKLRQ